MSARRRWLLGGAVSVQSCSLGNKGEACRSEVGRCPADFYFVVIPSALTALILGRFD